MGKEGEVSRRCEEGGGRRRRDESRKELGKGSILSWSHLIQKPSILVTEMKPDQKDISSQQPPKSKCHPTTTTLGKC